MENIINFDGGVLEAYDKPHKLVFLLHGYGDNGKNFIHIAQNLILNNINSNFYALNAPSYVEQFPSGRQWFDLYPNGISFEHAGPKEIEIIKKDCLKSLAFINKNITEICNRFKLKYEDCFILGFSQGAMIAYELGKYSNERFAGCILLSGRIISSSNEQKQNFSRTPILLLHGDEDIVLEPKYFYESVKILRKNAFSFESNLLKGEGHTISNNAIKIIQNFIKKNV